MKKLGISLTDLRNGSSGNVDIPEAYNGEPAVSPPPSKLIHLSHTICTSDHLDISVMELLYIGSQSPRRKETERQRSLNIERWLKNKFREGFHGMKTAFEEIDTDKTGVVSPYSHNAYLEVLSTHFPISQPFSSGTSQ